MACSECGGTGWYVTPPLKCRDGKMRRTRCKCSCGSKEDTCHPYDCNPLCPLCGDTPSCGSGSWRFNGRRHEHRCHGVDAQAGHSEVLCDVHDPDEVIKGLRSALKTKVMELDLAAAEVRAWRAFRKIKTEEGLCESSAAAVLAAFEYAKLLGDVDAARAATDADPVLRAMIGGGE